jgi:hypothetical protein
VGVDSIEILKKLGNNKELKKNISSSLLVIFLKFQKNDFIEKAAI